MDAHGDDKLGRLALTDAGREPRDLYVADAARALGIPMASALGGGYGADRMALARRLARTMMVLANGT